MPEHSVVPAQTSAAPACPVCHQPVQSAFYFCPNCGKSLREPPLSTSLATQIGIYLFSIILPMILFLAVSRWPGIKYARSHDPRARMVGFIAIALFALSTIITFWLSIVWIQSSIQASLNDLNGLGVF